MEEQTGPPLKPQTKGCSESVQQVLRPISMSTIPLTGFVLLWAGSSHVTAIPSPPRNLCANIINKSSITLDTRFGFWGEAATRRGEARRPFFNRGCPPAVNFLRNYFFWPKINARISVCGPTVVGFPLLWPCRLSTCHTHRQQLFEHRGCCQQGDEERERERGRGFEWGETWPNSRDRDEPKWCQSIWPCWNFRSCPLKVISCRGLASPGLACKLTCDESEENQKYV